MARIKLLEKNEVEPLTADIYQKSEDSVGKVINLFKALAHSPKILRDFSRLGTTLLLKGETSRKLLELAIIRVGEINEAPYELAAHRQIGLDCGISQEQIDDICKWENSINFSGVEKAILQYTDEVSLKIRASESTFNTLREYFNEKQIVEITVTIGYYNMVCRFLEPIQIDLEND